MTISQRLMVKGDLRVPGDKSISHRALMFAVLATGTSRIHGILQSEDVHSTANVLNTLGADIPGLAPVMTLYGRGPRDFLPPASNLNCGNSGTTTRLMMGVAAAQPFAATFTGDPSLSRRPMRRVAAPLSAMGARLEFAAADGLPLTVHGGELKSISWHTEAASAQVKSAILLAGVCAGVPVSVVEPAPSRDHTERFLRALGAPIASSDGRIDLGACVALGSFDMRVPGDPSSAAFFAALGGLADGGELCLRDVGLNPGRVGAFAAIARMGVDLQVVSRRDDGPEPMGDVVVRPGGLHGVVIGADEIPSLIDELPMLACMATRAEGDTIITGAQELRHKESDRITSVVENLRSIGAEAQELPDGMRIRGARKKLQGTVRTHGDHRLAMAFGVLSASPGVDIEIDDRSCVAVSYPTFWSDLECVSQ
jgi:3-phosphoshikimate 1-carboxyvinyltransferase